MLIAVMRLAEHGVHTTATLALNGAVLSGRVIGKKAYIHKIRKQFNCQVELICTTEETLMVYFGLEKPLNSKMFLLTTLLKWVS